MNQISNQAAQQRPHRPWEPLLFCLCCFLLNLLLSQLVSYCRLPLYLDSIGTVLAAVMCGYIPGIAVGYLTNTVSGLSDSISLYYSTVSVINAILAAYLAQRGFFRKIPRLLLAILLFALTGSILRALISWGIDGFVSAFWGELSAVILIELADKAITVAAAALLIRLFSRNADRLTPNLWRQTPLRKDEIEAASKETNRTVSLRAKILLLISAVMLIIAVATTGISFYLFHRSTVESQVKVGTGITQLMDDFIDQDRVDEFIQNGESAEGYEATEAVLTDIRNSSQDIEYVYVYRILEDGCHVVFDPDTEDVPGADPGEVIPFDDAFLPYLPALLAGEPIEPVISNESFGWLLTIYTPLYDSGGRCACYAAVDISMQQLLNDEISFLARVIILFIGFFLLILTVTLQLAKYNIILPIDTMALAADSFAFNSEQTRDESVAHLQKLAIRTGDEIENLYLAFTKTSEDMVRYIEDVNRKNETISRMQSSLIEIMADMVESRDKYTGDHVRKTAAYSAVIMDQLRKEGIYTDTLTDEYVSDVIHSAPLHDVGKIKVSDTLLNKPGKLTDEEFQQMKNHTLSGREIISSAANAVSESSYLSEAMNLATYHHERWDGRGYPCGLKGEEIPLSARIMAVADVFDALVSKRSYKEGFPIEKALDIIREGVGSHFDPQVAKAFLDAEEEVRRIAATNMGSVEPTKE